MCGFDPSSSEDSNIDSYANGNSKRSQSPPPPPPPLPPLIVPSDTAPSSSSSDVIPPPPFTDPNTIQQQPSISPKSEHSISPKSQPSPPGPKQKKSKRASLAGGVAMAEIDELGKAKSIVQARESAMTVSKKPRERMSLAYAIETIEEEVPPPQQIEPPTSSFFFQTVKTEEKVVEPSIAVKSTSGDSNVLSPKKAIITTSLGGGNGGSGKIQRPLPPSRPQPASKWSFFGCCSKNEIKNQVVDRNRPIELKDTTIPAPTDVSGESQITVQSTPNVFDNTIEGFRQYLAAPVYSNVLKPIGSVTHDYVVKPTNDYVVQPTNDYVVQPTNDYVVKPVGNVSHTYVAGPIYSNVLEPVGHATTSATTSIGITSSSSSSA